MPCDCAITQTSRARSCRPLASNLLALRATVCSRGAYVFLNALFQHLTHQQRQQQTQPYHQCAKGQRHLRAQAAALEQA